MGSFRDDKPWFVQGDPGDENAEDIKRIEKELGAVIREFGTGATRDTDSGKLDYEGFFSPTVLERRAKYMHSHRVQSDGSMRASDNWQKGIPRDEYMKSAFRHFMEWWDFHRSGEDPTEAICALMFNCEGYLHELLVG